MSNKKLDVHPLADEEAKDAFSYYKKRNIDAATRFRLGLDRCFTDIETRPMTFQTHLFRTRRCVMPNFPYLSSFVIDPMDSLSLQSRTQSENLDIGNAE